MDERMIGQARGLTSFLKNRRNFNKKTKKNEDFRRAGSGVRHFTTMHAPTNKPGMITD